MNDELQQKIEKLEKKNREYLLELKALQEKLDGLEGRRKATHSSADSIRVSEFSGWFQSHCQYRRGCRLGRLAACFTERDKEAMPLSSKRQLGRTLSENPGCLLGQRHAGGQAGRICFKAFWNQLLGGSNRISVQGGQI